MTYHKDFNNPIPATGADGIAHEHGLTTSDLHSQSPLPADILELLQRHAEELLRTSREAHRHQASSTDAPIVDPWALAGTGTETAAAGTSSNGRQAGTLQKLLAIGEKLLVKLESATQNPFDFLP